MHPNANKLLLTADYFALKTLYHHYASTLTNISPIIFTPFFPQTALNRVTGALFKRYKNGPKGEETKK